MTAVNRLPACISLDEFVQRESSADCSFHAPLAVGWTFLALKRNGGKKHAILFSDSLQGRRGYASSQIHLILWQIDKLFFQSEHSKWQKQDWCGVKWGQEDTQIQMLSRTSSFKLTQWWFLYLRYRPAPCVGWCCCVLPLTSSCETPMGCYTSWLERDRRLEATRAPRSPPMMLASSDPFEASGLSGCEEQKEEMMKKVTWTCRYTSRRRSGFNRWFAVGNPELLHLSI